MEQTRRRLADPEAYARAEISRFVAESWPFPGHLPQIYFDPRALEPGPPWSRLHAKCVVVDGVSALLSSANFSVAAQERNIEAGVLLEDPAFAGHLARQWLGLVDAGLVREAPAKFG